MLARTEEPDRIQPGQSLAALVVAAKTELAAAKFYAGLVRLVADSEGFSLRRAEEAATYKLVTLSGTIARLLNDEVEGGKPVRPHSMDKVDFNTVAGDIEERFSPANASYVLHHRHMLGL